jgi:hypothetical protein
VLGQRPRVPHDRLMATVRSQEVVGALIAGDGVYPGDPAGNPVVRIVACTDAGGRRVHGLVYADEARRGELLRYDLSPDCLDVVVVFSRPVPG